MPLLMKILAGAMLAFSGWALSPGATAEPIVTQNGITKNGIELAALGESCGGDDVDAICAQLGGRYDTTGRGVIDPAESATNLYFTPGSDTGNEDQVRSYNVTTTADQPPKGTTPIVVTGLENAFDFYWGSVDTFNVVELFSGSVDGAPVATFTGQDLANLLNEGVDPASDDFLRANPQGNFGIDQYVAFTGGSDVVFREGTDDRLGSFDIARLSVTDEDDETGVAFEVATTAVPEPSVIGLLGLGLLGFGLIRLRARGNA